MFKDSGKRASSQLNKWLTEHSEVLLIDIRPILSSAGVTTIYAIVEIPASMKEEI